MLKTITLQLKPNKNARHINFEIELEKQGTAREWETLEEVEAVRLSVRGSIRKGSGCCQMQDHIRGYRARVRKADLPLFDFILYIWDKYHLNDLKAGTKQQEAILSATNHKGGASSYKEDCDFLASLDLLTDRGYKYGSSWLYMPIEAEDLAKIEELLK